MANPKDPTSPPDPYYPQEGDVYTCLECGMEIEVTESCTCKPPDVCPCFRCCAVEMTLIRRFASRSVMVCLFPCSSKWRCAPGQQSGYSSTSASHSLSCKKAQLKADFLAVELARDIDLRNRTHGDGESGCALARRSTKPTMRPSISK